MGVVVALGVVVVGALGVVVGVVAGAVGGGLVFVGEFVVVGAVVGAGLVGGVLVGLPGVGPSARRLAVPLPRDSLGGLVRLALPDPEPP